ncbi:MULTISPECIES: 30S ribosomal protein S18 [Mycolicibacterium]|uniref:Small ribosomal subunit protein bS18A n=4 Tax=Mycolicibacterium TaxID=1866885 RepID=RS181_MYCS2|nr:MULTISPECIES: 30S ribosomal protein S18 [Mycolicibacterium]A0R549.1 RecName: Full=Small ribosomal subunit protein bS18A; AltName: Full=30S ribosomal protein S18 1 [Mycolicibacterium smegmatis MC2 155]6DZK_r Chain r, 30S ribosomal protein S18 1 [Mycolicibacterium smegmatis MC2 155]ABK71162.1 ribosomal protein S18 [Mycolicibacterium smegmatis MC2 155]MBE9621207.1 30S ribosomal protein S18 [Mycolicibacterium smegmatis]MBE9627601.1 30S ribosomal protein S18 [Mycolicibacterium smegmatis]MBE9634
MMAVKKSRKRTAATELKKPRRNQLEALGVTTIDYKDVAVLRTFLSERGKIRSRHVTGLTPQQQRQVATAIKNAREMALLPMAGPR